MELVEAWCARGIETALLMPLEALGELTRGDVAVARLDVLPSLDGVEPGVELLDLLEVNGVTVRNRPASLLAAHDKLMTETCLAAAGIRRVPALHGKTVEQIRQHPLPLVLKPRFGSWGRDVFRCRSPDELEHALAEIVTRGWFRKDGAVVQSLFGSPGFDLRLIIAGGETVGAIERVARPGEWRTNISLGGTIRRARLSTEARELGVAAAAALGADLIGVDLLPTSDGYTVLELNGAVEFDGQYSLDGGDVYEAAARSLDLRFEVGVRT